MNCCHKMRDNYELTLRWGHYSVVFCGFLISLFFLTCQNPFSTRDPEEPENSQSTWFQPVSPEIVLDNLAAAIREKNVDNYMRCFGSTEMLRSGFWFVPEISVANNYQSVFINWNSENERNYVNNLFGQMPVDSVSSLILTDNSEFQYGDSIRTSKDYDLFIAHSNPSVPRQLNGRLDLTVRKGPDALWYISFWADYKIDDRPVWSILKAEF